MALSKNVFYTLLSQLPQFAGSVLVSILSTRILGPEGKGAYSILFYEAVLIGFVLNLGINLSATYFISSKRITADRILGIGSYHIALNLALLAVFFAGAWYSGTYPALFPEGYLSPFFIVYLAGSFGLGYINSLFSAIFQGQKNFRRVNQSILVKAALNTLLFLALYIIHQWHPVSLEVVLLCLLVVNASETIYWVVFYAREFGLWPAFGKGMAADMQMMLSFAMIGYFSNLLNFFNYRLDIWVIEYFLPLDQLGFYVLAVNLTQMLWMVSEPISTVVTPYLNQPESKERNASFMAFHRLNTSSVLLLSILGWILAEWLIPLIYGADFSDAVLPFRILLVGNFFACASKTYAVLNYISNRVRFNLYATAAGLLVSVILDFTLIPRFGITGAAWASNAAYLCIFAFLYFNSRYRLRLVTNNPFIFTKSDLHILTHGQRI